MKSTFFRMLSLLLILMLPLTAMADAPVEEGYFIEGAGLRINLWEGGAEDVSWTYDLENTDTLIALENSPPAEGEALRTWLFAPGTDGESILTFSYSDPLQPRVLCYTVAVSGGAIVDILAEDLSEADELSGDEEAVALYDGETGGVELSIEGDMSRTETEGGILLTGADGMTTILINYQPEDDPKELFAQLETPETAAELNEDPEITVLDSYIDRESDPPCAILVESSSAGIVVYNGYAAPNGGVLHVHTSYLVGGQEEIVE